MTEDEKDHNVAGKELLHHQPRRNGMRVGERRKIKPGKALVEESLESS